MLQADFYVNNLQIDVRVNLNVLFWSIGILIFSYTGLEENLPQFRSLSRFHLDFLSEGRTSRVQ